MRTRISFFSLVLISILLTLSTSACGRSMIKGRVVDAVTGKPIDKAAVYIEWAKPGSGPIGLAGTVIVEEAEDLTDAEGFFDVPKYAIFSSGYLNHLVVYKKGYVCWHNQNIFPTYERRKDFSLEDGMVIKLERFKEEYNEVKHAIFTTTWSIGRKGGGLFDTAIKSEMKIEEEFLQGKRRN